MVGAGACGGEENERGGGSSMVAGGVVGGVRPDDANGSLYGRCFEDTPVE